MLHRPRFVTVLYGHQVSLPAQSTFLSRITPQKSRCHSSYSKKNPIAFLLSENLRVRVRVRVRVPLSYFVRASYVIQISIKDDS